ncbi:hypothetical protein [Mucilaginibacter sp.]|jgi:hypothetical protein|uniref:hypothetical protein n=1 Tax=Mucilaginibacter sp. TaxID=1882438 RepID=UPI0035628E20
MLFKTRTTNPAAVLIEWLNPNADIQLRTILIAYNKKDAIMVPDSAQLKNLMQSARSKIPAQPADKRIPFSGYIQNKRY